MKFLFSDRLYKKALNLSLLIAFASLLIVFGLELEFGFHWSLVLLMIPSLILLAVTDGHRREYYRDLVGSNLKVSDKTIKYVQPKNGYQLEKSLEEIQKSKFFNFLGCPVIQIYFHNNERINIVALEQSFVAYEKILARTGFKT